MECVRRRNGTRSCPARCCGDLFNDWPELEDGDYFIDPNFGNTKDAILAYCNRTSVSESGFIYAETCPHKSLENCPQLESMKTCGAQSRLTCSYKCENPNANAMKIMTANGEMLKVTDSRVSLSQQSDRLDVTVTGSHNLFPLQNMFVEHVCAHSAEVECYSTCYGSY